MSFRSTLFTVVLALSTVTAAVSQNWELTNGPGASVTALAVDSKGLVFAATDLSGVYYSYNQGQTWNSGIQGMEYDKPVRSLYVDSNDVLWCSQMRSGVFKSTDHGVSWVSVSKGIPTQAIVFCSIKTHPGQKTKLFAGVDAGTNSTRTLYFSPDEGEHWKQIPIPTTSATSVVGTSLSPNSDAMFAMVGYNRGLFRKADTSASWVRIEAATGSSEENDNFTVMANNKQGHMFVGRNALPSSTTSKNAIVMRTKDDGTQHWDYLTNGWPTMASTDWPEITNNKVTAIACGPNNEVYATTRTTGSYKSTDNGDTWTRFGQGLDNGDGSATAVAIDGFGNVFVSPIGTLVFKSIVQVVSVNEETPEVVRVHNAYPNPADYFLTVRYTATAGTHVRIQLMNTAGQQVGETFEQDVQDGMNEFRFSTADLTTGVYVARMIADGAVTTHRFVVNR